MLLTALQTLWREGGREGGEGEREGEGGGEGRREGGGEGGREITNNTTMKVNTICNSILQKGNDKYTTLRHNVLVHMYSRFTIVTIVLL